MGLEQPPVDVQVAPLSEDDARVKREKVKSMSRMAGYPKREEFSDADRARGSKSFCAPKVEDRGAISLAEAEKIGLDEAEHAFEVTRNLISGARSLSAPMSLWLLEVEERPQIFFNLAWLVRGSYLKPTGWPPSNDPLFDALGDSRERAYYLAKTTGNVEVLTAAFDLVDLYDVAVHAPERWPEFDEKLEEFERLILSQIQEGRR